MNTEQFNRIAGAQSAIQRNIDESKNSFENLKAAFNGHDTDESFNICSRSDSSAVIIFADDLEDD